MALRAKKEIGSALVSYKQCPAKTYIDLSGRVQIGRTVFDHCQIVGEVAKELIRRSPVQHLFPPGSAFTAATHDIGKVSPTFYSKLYRACGLPFLPNVNPDLEKNWNGHAGVSQITANALGAPEYIPEILGQHHGFSPDVAGKRALDEAFGGQSWQREREKLVQDLRHVLGEDWPQLDDYATARLLAGLTSVADWIGSGQHFDLLDDKWQERIDQAVDEAGFITPEFKLGLSFEQVFGFAPRTAQSLLFEQASQPGVYVLEAPMGVGKTEAALYAAYQLLASQQASGIYFALPTQLTSNKIFERFNQFLEQIVAPDCAHRSLLLHANAWLFATEMGEEGRPGGAWFNQAKRGLLAPFAVGTIDQALMAAMNVKHGFVRAFGLAGKVVILDEVHTYDAYTGTLLDALIDLLRQLDCTVIVLSATLNQARRQELIGSETYSVDYPLITALPKNSDSVAEIGVPIAGTQHVTLKLEQDELVAIEEALLRAEQGQQVLWIENTVKEAQERYLQLAARALDLGAECGLLHSRFTVTDRQALEEQWVNLFGKQGWLGSKRQQKGRILIGTQVLEQSLDIDADFLVSRFAPTDMLLQRFGRLWRHVETPRNPYARQEAWLLAPNLNKAIHSPESAFGASAYVYSPYVLCRSLEVWLELKRVCLPIDIRSLIEATYQKRPEQGSMAIWLRQLEEGCRDKKGQIALKQLARIGLAQAGKTMPESQAQTRYSETDAFEVLMLRSICYDSQQRAGVLVLLDGKQIVLPLNRSAISRASWRERTKQLMHAIVQVRPSEAPKPVNRERLQQFGLHHCFYLGNPLWPDDESLLRVALVSESDLLQGVDNQLLNDKYEIEYRPDLGYRTIKK
ncbi:CRISPR-associated protein Cas3 [Thiopseudomonas alkaliphila]|uniref:CRISPR-associated helicase Cas3' n=1 Tax=Thiopseudomonas alkaliphila TaxID=1697053 RepID=UPI00069FBF32|nr:CRISPR-associated helicase Cas3' [Thiopseudomonas alkaliphila]AKX55472.1 CRISPR-associated protein Cas3 [Thiopseudomonas alkaliphila]